MADETNEQRDFEVPQRCEELKSWKGKVRTSRKVVTRQNKRIVKLKARKRSLRFNEVDWESVFSD